MYAIKNKKTNQYFIGDFARVDIGYAIKSTPMFDYFDSYIACWNDFNNAKKFLDKLIMYTQLNANEGKNCEIVEV